MYLAGWAGLSHSRVLPAHVHVCMCAMHMHMPMHTTCTCMHAHMHPPPLPHGTRGRPPRLRQRLRLLRL